MIYISNQIKNRSNYFLCIKETVKRCPFFEFRHLNKDLCSRPLEIIMPYFQLRSMNCCYGA